MPTRFSSLVVIINHSSPCHQKLTTYTSEQSMRISGSAAIIWVFVLKMSLIVLLYYILSFSSSFFNLKYGSKMGHSHVQETTAQRRPVQLWRWEIQWYCQENDIPGCCFKQVGNSTQSLSSRPKTADNCICHLEKNKDQAIERGIIDQQVKWAGNSAFN